PLAQPLLAARVLAGYNRRHGKSTALIPPTLPVCRRESAMHSHRSPLGLLCVCAVVAGLAGCAGGGAKRCAVSGAVKWRGQPLDQGAITFLPEDPALGTSGGALIQDGRYSIPADQGLLPGRYKVTISSADPKKALDPNADPGAPGPVY